MSGLRALGGMLLFKTQNQHLISHIGGEIRLKVYYSFNDKIGEISSGDVWRRICIETAKRSSY